MRISQFENVFKSSNGDITSIDEFLNNVKYGVWREQSQKINSISDKKQRQKEKQKVPYVTISGLFNRRVASDIVEHSGFICLDFDDLEDIEETINIIVQDHFTYSCFKSISGKGLAVIVKIDPKRHLDAFLGLEAYFVNKYQLYVDRACKDVTRARFVSYDENLYINRDSNKFTNYIPKSQNISKSKLPDIITGENDIEHIIKQINEDSIDITDSTYDIWLKIGFAISDEFGEGGRSYFHSISYYSDKYNEKRCDKQYNHCLKHGGSGINYATFLYFCKSAGISIISEETKHIITASDIARNAGRGINDIVSTLKEVDGYEEDLTRPIVEKVFKKEKISSNNKLSKLDSLEIFLKSNFSLQFNEITRSVENGNEEIDSKFINSLYIRARKEVDDNIRYDDVEKLINSDFTESYNPLIEFFEKNAHLDPKGAIDNLAKSINSDSPYKGLFIKKWIVGIVASIHGDHSPLLLALAGSQQTGKTEFFRRLLPDELQFYYAESKLDAGKDDEILMTQKIIILDDEFGGKSKAEAKRLKEITSKQYFTLREPYGRKNVRLRRLAVLAGTSNDDQLLNDPTGNRRIIPINVISIDHKLYNSIDKKEVMIEAYNLWKEGFNWKTTREEVSHLRDNTSKFEQITLEREMINRYFKLPQYIDDLLDPKGIEYFQASEMKSHIEKNSQQRLNLVKFTQELKRIGFVRDEREINGTSRFVYGAIKIDGSDNDNFSNRGFSEISELPI